VQIKYSHFLVSSVSNYVTPYRPGILSLGIFARDDYQPVYGIWQAAAGDQ
jgi:hypothetical protein